MILVIDFCCGLHFESVAGHQRAGELAIESFGTTTIVELSWQRLATPGDAAAFAMCGFESFATTTTVELSWRRLATPLPSGFLTFENFDTTNTVELSWRRLATPLPLRFLKFESFGTTNTVE